ncbi:Uma2 family endonuclease [Nocardiopsis sp. RSe5-2]|uniref:Uma2 family endonuclease n=1 Tax=Nocardiopsis endophytica TaxID=3018445 RepID=A0ABT4U7J2_9ACTN|nr:Uma2 family endonuclease [Nocardiopsis endophytica]MDA2812924.1 Uma2 family endonuclease [Nocardiopsis endophytica]
MSDIEESRVTALVDGPVRDVGTGAESVGGELFAILDSLPETRRWRAEILDGETITLSPTPIGLHQENVYLLDEQLRPCLPKGHRTEGNLEIRLPALERSVVPDLFVAPVAVLRTPEHSVPPDDVLLVAEVVSPGSTRADRTVKPGIYAQAQIPCFILVDPLEENTTVFSRPGKDEYKTVQKFGFGETFKIADPFEAQVDSSDFLAYE